MPSSRRDFLLGLTALGLVAVPVASSVAPTVASPSYDHDLSTPLTAASVAFEREIRALWEDHVTWTRLFIVDFVAGLPATDATTPPATPRRPGSRRAGSGPPSTART